jgi:hypothetical protein
MIQLPRLPKAEGRGNGSPSIPADESAFRRAIETGALVPGKRPCNDGNQTHADLCC